MNTTNHTSPSGEDAANEAIGERPIDEEDAFQDWWKTRKGQETNAYHGWMARAALTAEKVAQADPVAWPYEITRGHIECLIADHQRDGQKQLKHGLNSSGSYLIRVAESFRWCLEQIDAASPPAPVQSGEPDIKALVNRFLAWPLPQTVCADGCATNSSYAFPRSGTNLLNADEAEAMLRHVLSAAPPAQTQVALTDEARDARHWRYLAQHAVIIDASVEGMVSFTVAKDADSGVGEDAAARAIDMLAAHPASGGDHD